MSDWQFVLLWLFAFGGWLCWLMGIYIRRKSSDKQPKAKELMGARIVARLFQMALWLVAVARAAEAAWMEYQFVQSVPDHAVIHDLEMVKGGRK